MSTSATAAGVASSKLFARFCLRGKVIHGHGRGGTQLGYPTANIELTQTVVEELKVYNNLVLYGYGCIEACGVTGALKSMGPFPFAMSIGFNPHFKDTAVSAEVHFLHKFESDFYSAVVRVVVLGSLREQAAFTTLEALVKMIDGDVQNTVDALKQEENRRYEALPFVQPQHQLTDEERQTPFFKRIA